MSGLDTKHLLAAVTVADEGSLSRAAIKLNITQSAVSKQILGLEEILGHEVFRRNSRHLEMTAAGEVFVVHARYSLQMQDRAVQLSREAYAEAKTVLHVGKSPYTDPFFISALTAIQRAAFPALRLDIESNFSPELTKQVLAGMLDLAVLCEAKADPHLSTLELDTSPFYVLIQEAHDIARSKAARLEDLHGSPWIRLARHVHPELYDRFTRSLERRHVQPTSVHHVTTAEEALQFVLEVNGVATITRSGAWRVLERGVTMRPLLAEGLILSTVLAVRSDADSRRLGPFIRAVGKKLCGPEREWLSSIAKI